VKQLVVDESFLLKTFEGNHELVVVVMIESTGRVLAMKIGK
jgi:hypothetical protein